MKNLKTIMVPGFLIAALTGCWDQDVEDGNGEIIGTYVPITSTLTANFVKGPVTGATCELFEVSDAGVQGSSIATSMTTAGVVDFGDDIEYFGMALVQCFGGSYTDEATGDTLVAPEMRAVVSIERDAEFSVTPLTEMATLLAEVDGDLGTAISTHNAAVGSTFGFSGDITMVVPTDLGSAEATNNYEGQYATVLALISQLHSTGGGSLSDLIDSLAGDLEDGEFSQESLGSMSQAVVDLDFSEVAANLSDDALETIVDRAGIPAEEEALQAGVAELSEDDDIGMPGNDIDSVSVEIVGTDLVITQTHKGAKDSWHTIRAYFNVDDSDTMMTPIAGGAAALTGLVAEYGYVFTFNGGVDPLEWYTDKSDATGGAWVLGTSAAIATGGDTDVTVMTIPLSEIGDPASIADIQMMFVGTGAGWGTDQLPNDGMYQYVLPVVAVLSEDDDIGMPGNDIDSASVEIVGTDLVITQAHKGAKDSWHTIRAYFNVDDSDTMMTPIAAGAASLTGLVAEYGYVFTFNGGVDPLEWYTDKSDATGGAWVLGTSAATATGGDTDVTVMTIPLSEIGDPASVADIQMMFVGTGDGWGTDQLPNDGMYQYVAPMVAELSEDDDIGMPGNDIDSASVEVVGTDLVITQTHKGVKDSWHTIRAYFNVDDSDTMMTPIASGAAGLTGLVAEYGYVFTFNGGVDPLEWYTDKSDATGGAWVLGTSAAIATGGDTDVTVMTIPLSEIGDPASIADIQMMFVGTGDGWGTDQLPNDGMFNYAQ